MEERNAVDGAYRFFQRRGDSTEAKREEWALRSGSRRFRRYALRTVLSLKRGAAPPYGGEGLHIQMSSPSEPALVRHQQCVTDRRPEPAVALCCVASIWPRLGPA
ncbi:unnamed protein product [Lota lota]